MHGSRHEVERIHVGWASTSITPDQPVQLDGQFHERISETVRDLVTATALALEAGNEGVQPEQAVIVSCDLLHIPKGVQDRVRAAVAPRVHDLDVRKLFIAATHTHTAPVTREGAYPPPGPGVMRPAEYVDWLVEHLANAVVQAWQGRCPGGVSWALGHAAVGFCRRIVYDDGTAQMYGSTDTPRFRNLEGGQDHGVEMLFCWDQENHPTGVAINLACPSQVVEMKRYVSADFWGAVRRELGERYGQGFHVLPLCSAAGDQSPRDLVRRGRGEADMYDESGLEERAGHIVHAVDLAFELARGQVKDAPVFKHVVEDLDLPGRKISADDAQQARRTCERLVGEGVSPDSSSDGGRLRRQQAVLSRYEQQGQNPRFGMELHVLRLGEIALATNPFELFLDYGLRIKARSKALQTFVVQLACDTAGYLPTAKAVAGGGYGATAAEGLVGPEGGKALVERTVELINGLWPTTPAAKRPTITAPRC